jgi:hypothetical protein
MYKNDVVAMSEFVPELHWFRGADDVDNDFIIPHHRDTSTNNISAFWEWVCPQMAGS